MASRYWVGGSGTWNSSSTANWAATSGGASGASAPVAGDNVFFDQAATYTVTVSSPNSVNDFTVSAGTVTFAASSGTPTITGNFSIVAATKWSSGPNIILGATTTGKTITTNGVALRGITFNGVGGGWILQDDLNATTTVSHQAGAIDLNNKTFKIISWTSTAAGSRSLTFGTGTIDCSNGNPATFSITNASGLTFDGASGTISFPNGTAGTHSLTLPAGVTIGTVSCLAHTTINAAGATINNLSLAYNSNIGGPTSLLIASNLTIGTLSMNGTDAQRRCAIFSNTVGTTRTIAVSTWSSPADIDVRDITLTGMAPPTIARGGDCGGNSGMGFPAAKTVYWNHASNTSFYSSSWATTATGTPAINNQPLAQDTIASTSGSGSYPATMVWPDAVLPTIAWGNVSSTVAITPAGQRCYCHGDLTFSSSVTLATNTLRFYKAGGTSTIIHPGTLGAYIYCDSPTLALGGNLAGTSGVLVQPNYGFTTNNYNLTCGWLTAGNLAAATWNLGSSAITLLANSGVVLGLVGPTINAGTSTFEFKPGSAGTMAFTHGGQSLNNIKYSPQVASTILNVGAGLIAAGTFSDAALVAGTIQFQAGSTNSVNAMTVNGASGALITLKSSSSGSSATLKKPSPWKIGANSILVSGTTGLTVATDAVGGMDYISAQDIVGIDTSLGGNLMFGSNF